MAPRFWLCDFDMALRKAISTVFPESACFGDLWHFYHDTTKWCRTKNMTESINTIVGYLRDLATTMDRDQFHAKLRTMEQICL
jgi:hypothetical protein